MLSELWLWQSLILRHKLVDFCIAYLSFRTPGNKTAGQTWQSSILKMHRKAFVQFIWAPQVGLLKVTFLPALKIVHIIMVDSGTRYYPWVGLRCLYISNLGDQAAGLRSWSTQWLPINRLGSIRRAHPEQRFPHGYGLWHRGTCPQPSALIWQMILYQRPLHWFGW